MGQDLDIFVLPIYQENKQLKQEIAEMLVYIKELQLNYISNQKLFEAMVKTTYCKNQNRFTQTDSVTDTTPILTRKLVAKELKLQLKRNWMKE